VTTSTPVVSAPRPGGRAPFADAAAQYLASDVAHFTVPGHKRNMALVGDDPLLLSDMPHLGAVDDLRMSRDLLGQAHALAAQAWGSSWARFSVSGSTHPCQAMCLALGAPGDEVIVARSCHKSVYAGLVMAGLEPVWVGPDVDPATGLPLGLPVERVAEALRTHPAARAVIVVEPSYTGVVSDVAALARVAHDHGVPLVCDQAWGAHFAFHPLLPPCAVAAGADLVVMSVHKTLTCFSQGSVLHAVDRGLVDLERLATCFDALLTTSASGAIYASIDRARDLMQRRGRRLVQSAMNLAARFRAEVDGVAGARCVDDTVCAHPSAAGFDPLKLVVDLSRTAVSGYALEEVLRSHGVMLEMADRATLIPLLTVGDTRSSVSRLSRELVRALRTAPRDDAREPAASLSWRVAPTPACSLREAFFAPRERVPAARAVGRVAAEIVAPYPPGIPVLAPGEVVTGELLDALRSEVSYGARISGPSDASLKTMVVLR
jgi:lysine decarboxylase